MVAKVEWWLWPVVVVVVVADGRGGCGWCCGCFLDSGIYYFIVEIGRASCRERVLMCV